MDKKIKVCLYLEFLYFWKGILFKNIGTGLLSSYKNQKRMLERLGIEYTESWSDDCDVLQINTPWLKSLYLMRRVRRLGKPIIVWAHVTAEDIKGVFRFSSILSPLAKRYLKYAYNQADIILTPSEYTRKLVINYGINPNKIIAQSNGVDLKKFVRDAEMRRRGREYLKVKNETVVGTVALAIYRKGIDTFINMAKVIPVEKFIWVGAIYNSALAPALPKTLPSNMLFTGYVPDIIAVYNAFDIFVFASYEENQGMVILEAAAVGLPIIVRDIPVYEGWLRHGENCMKAKTDKEFVEYAELLKSDKELREKLSGNAMILAEENSLERMGERTLALYNRLLTK